MRTLPILHQDEYLVVVNKPAGLLVHRSDLDRHATEYAMQIVRDQLGRWVYPLHRLDKPTSGTLVFALDRDMARIMTRDFTDRKIIKSYIAVVRGYAKEAERIEYPLKERLDRIADSLADNNKPAQDAVTDYQRLATVELPFPVGRYPTARFSLLRVMPLTGRMHQIRHHLKHVFHPVIGDSTYGDKRQNAFFAAQYRCARLLLHAYEIAFPHPVTGADVRIQAPLDTAFSDVLDAIAWEPVVCL